MITKNPSFPRKADIRGIMSEKSFKKKLLNCPFPCKVDIRGIISEKRFKKKL